MSENQAEKDSVKSMEYHRQVLKGKLEDESYVAPSSYPLAQKQKKAKDKAQKQGQDFKDGYSADENITDKNRVANKYISPSDNIMSPCTQKLSALRGKQFGKFVSRLSFFSFVFLSSSL